MTNLMLQPKQTFFVRWKRRAGTVFVGFSLSISAVAVVFAVHTYWWFYYANFTTYVNDPSRPHAGVCSIVMGDGRVNIVRHRGDQLFLHPGQLNQSGWRFGRLRVGRPWYPNTPYTFGLKGDREGWVIAFPLWLIALMGALPVGLLLLSRWHQLRVRTPGHCAICEYDLRATPTRCPECGWVPPPTARRPGSP